MLRNPELFISFRASVHDGFTPGRSWSGVTESIFLWNKSSTQSIIRIIKWGGLPSLRTVAMSDGFIVWKRIGNKIVVYLSHHMMVEKDVWGDCIFKTTAAVLQVPQKQYCRKLVPLNDPLYYLIVEEILFILPLHCLNFYFYFSTRINRSLPVLSLYFSFSNQKYKPQYSTNSNS